MLTRQNIPSNQNEFFQNSLLTKPSYFHSLFDNFAAGLATPSIAANDVANVFSQKPTGESLHSTLQAIQLGEDSPEMGKTQYYSDMVANMIGSALNPITLPFAALGGATGNIISKGVYSISERALPSAVNAFARKPLKEVLSHPLSKYIPRTIGKEGEEEALSVGLLGKKALDAYTIGVGVSIPFAISDKYRHDTNHIEWGGVARESMEMGGFGVAIGSIPFTWGIIRSKIREGKLLSGKKVEVKEENKTEMQDVEYAYENGHLSKKEYDWYLAYNEYKKNPDNIEFKGNVERIASEIAIENGHNVNTVRNEIKYDLLTENDVKNLQAAISDQVSSDMPDEHKTSLSDFIVHNSLDKLIENKSALEGVRGYVDFVKEKVKLKSSKIKEIDSIFEKSMEKSTKENATFSQKKLFKFIKKQILDPKHLDNLPFTVPESLKKNIKILDKINKLKKNFKKNPNKNITRRIKELKKSINKLKSPNEELKEIKEKLLFDKKNNKNIESNIYYSRLVDLSQVWKKAKILLDRINIEKEYEKQETFVELFEQILKLNDSNSGKLADPNKVINYIQSRIDDNLYKTVKIESAIKDNKELIEKISLNLKEKIENKENILEETEAEKLKEDFLASSEKFDEFKKSENIFSSLISCVLGEIE